MAPQTPQIEQTSASFTEEAEAAVQKSLHRVERRLRLKALDEALRTRGWPPEVTASDVFKAEVELRPSRDPRNPRDLRNLRDLDDRSYLRALEERADFLRSERPPNRRVSRAWRLLDTITRVYLVIGVIFAVGGLLYAPLLDRITLLLHDANWKRGLTLSLSGALLVVMSVLFRWINKRSTR